MQWQYLIIVGILLVISLVIIKLRKKDFHDDMVLQSKLDDIVTLLKKNGKKMISENLYQTTIE